MDILRKARKLEAGLVRVLDGAARTVLKSGALEPLEIVHAVVEKHWQMRFNPRGEGSMSSPSTASRYPWPASSMERRAQLAAVFDGEPSVAARITERLRSAGCRGLGSRRERLSICRRREQIGRTPGGTSTLRVAASPLLRRFAAGLPPLPIGPALS